MTKNEYLTKLFVSIWLIGLSYFALKSVLGEQHYLLTLGKSEYNGFIQIDSLSSTRGPSGRTWSYSFDFKSVGEMPKIETEFDNDGKLFNVVDLYKRKYIYNILKDESKETLIPVKWIKKGWLFYRKPIFTEINGKRNLGTNKGYPITFVFSGFGLLGITEFILATITFVFKK